jgi:hypothetical protein
MATDDTTKLAKQLDVARQTASEAAWRSFSEPEFAKWFNDRRGTLRSVSLEFDRFRPQFA